ncbi:hypothetical protein B296_00011680 [Ensete ventricosum]|uniref:Uncharacterized protein n=1 Tax=Ensete ventricosum TaxID=4639 RepID=A0A426Z7E0_ENSVE|nr:hypothetical protein B296_00011680 [Ensete ventricosum]
MRPPMGSRLVSWKLPPHQTNTLLRGEEEKKRTESCSQFYYLRREGTRPYCGERGTRVSLRISPRGVGFFPLTTLRRVDLRCNQYVGTIRGVSTRNHTGCGTCAGHRALLAVSHSLVPTDGRRKLIWSASQHIGNHTQRHCTHPNGCTGSFSRRRG